MCPWGSEEEIKCPGTGPVSRHVDAENRAQVLRKRSPGSQPLRMSSVPFQHCKIVVKFMLATNTMRGGEGGFYNCKVG